MTNLLKKVVNADPGTADVFGGNDLDSLADYYSGTDVTPKLADINTETRLRSGKKKLMNPANTFGYTEVASAIVADRNVTEPLLAANDTRVYEAATQTITNKTINATSNTITDTSTAAGDILKSDGTKFTRLAKGTANQVLAVNSGGTDVAWSTSAAGGGTATAQFVTLATDATLTNERVLTGGDGITLTDGGAGGNVTIVHDLINFAKTRVGFYEECFSGVGADNCGGIFKRSISGTGSDVYNESVTETGVFGMWTLDTGTTTTGRSGIQAGTGESFTLGQGTTTLEWRIKLPILSTAGEEYTLRLGFMDSLSGNPVDGAYFIYDRLTSVNWMGKTANNSTVSTKTSATAVSAAAWTRLKIVINAAGTSCAFYINGTEMANSPSTTNIPITAARQCTVEASLIKSAGTTARVVNSDYIAFDVDLTVSR